MRKAIFAFILAVCGVVGLIAAGTCAQADGTKPAGLVVDAESGQVLVANRANAAWYPASLTKLMTAYLAFLKSPAAQRFYLAASAALDDVLGDEMRRFGDAVAVAAHGVSA